MTQAHSIVSSYGVSLVTSPEDASVATDASLPNEQARALVRELEAHGIEASDVIDQDDRTRSWVHVTVA
jgi:hypothetical protein